MTAEQVVSAFCEAVTRKDVDTAMSYIAADCFYHNVPLEPVRGAAGIRQAMDTFFQLLGVIEIETLHQVAAGSVVMNERVDTFAPPGKGRVSLPVFGVFEVEGDKIVSWRDYFDVRQFTERTGLAM